MLVVFLGLSPDEIDIADTPFIIDGGISEDRGPVYSVGGDDTLVVTVPGTGLEGAFNVVRHFFRNPNPPELLSASFYKSLKKHI